MRLHFYPKTVAARRLATCPDALSEFKSGFGLETSLEQSVLPEGQPAGYDVNPAHLAKTIAFDTDIGIEEQQPKRDVLRFALFNRAGRVRYPGVTKGGTLKNSFTMPSFMLEQQIMTAGRPYMRLIDGKSGVKRPEGSTPCAVATVGGITTKLMMKSNLPSIKLRKNFEGGWNEELTGSESPDVGLAWAYDEDDYSDVWGHNEPDGPKQSMNNDNMWESPDAPIVSVHLDHTSDPVGHSNFPKDPEERSVDRDWNKGATKTNKEDVYHVLHNVFNKGSYDIGALPGVIFPCSSSGTSDDDDTPVNAALKTQVAATDPQLRQACSVSWRIQLLTQLISEGVATIWGAQTDEDRVRDLWFNDPEDGTFEGAAELKERLLTVNGHINTVWGTVLNVNGAITEVTSDARHALNLLLTRGNDINGFAVTGALTASIGSYIPTCDNMHIPATSSAAVLNGPTRGYNGDTLINCRPLLGSASHPGSWDSVATGVAFGPSKLCADTFGDGAHLAYVPDADLLIGATGKILSATEIGDPSGSFLTSGYYLGVRTNEITLLFEDQIESDVSDWDDGGSFFIWFFSTKEDK